MKNTSLSERVKQWNNGLRTKIVLYAKDGDFNIVKEELEDVGVVTDAGLTEVEKGSETVLVTWPMRKSEALKSFKRLRASI